MEAVFFDFGGVISFTDHGGIRRLEERHGLPEGGLEQALWENPEWQALRVGAGTKEAWLDAVARRLDELAGRPIPSIQHEWTAVLWAGLDESMLDLVHRLRGRCRVGMISNGTPTLEEELREVHKIDHLFDVVVNSASVGMRKPDPRIFRHAARILDLTPTVCVHIDDIMENVRGAEEAGFHAIHYQGHLPSLVSELQRLGLQW